MFALGHATAYPTNQKRARTNPAQDTARSFIDANAQTAIMMMHTNRTVKI
jgi:hypothetical protein